MHKRSNLADSLREVSGGTRKPGNVTVLPEKNPTPEVNKNSTSRMSTKAITVHYPPEVRQQLKRLAVDLDRTMEDIIAEGMNRLFAAHGLPEIAPQKTRD